MNKNLAGGAGLWRVGRGSEMELDRKPGSRDGKPSKTTRRKARQEGKKEDSIELQGTGDQPADPESGLVPGVTYSINKGRRWELVEQLKEASLEGEKRNTGQSEEKEEKERLESGVLVVEVRPEGHYYDSNQLNARLNPRAREKKEEDNEEPEMIKTRRGPEPKQNAPKKKDKTNQTCDDAPYNPDRKFVVTHKPGSKGDLFG